MPKKTIPKKTNGLRPFKEEHESFFKDVVYLVESTYNERHLFWEKYHFKPMFPDFKIESWVGEPNGRIITIGHVVGKPVALDITWAKLEGCRVMFYEGSGMIVDYEMIETWLSHFTDKFPLIQSTDSTNVGHCIRYCIEKRKKNND